MLPHLHLRSAQGACVGSATPSKNVSTERKFTDQGSWLFLFRLYFEL